jgi:hypothetical protein
MELLNQKRKSREINPVLFFIARWAKKEQGKEAFFLDRLLVPYSTWLVLIQRPRQGSLCLIL